jgi:hypothetical protein
VTRSSSGSVELIEILPFDAIHTASVLSPGGFVLTPYAEVIPGDPVRAIGVWVADYASRRFSRKQ